MESRNEIREFLTTRRARITPAQAGLPVYGETRRVPGLRRDEVAQLAAISVDYYIRLERGNVKGVSESVLEAVARALQLDGAERSHWLRLARSPVGQLRLRYTGCQRTVRQSVQIALNAITSPAIVRNGELDILAANKLGHALHSDMYGSSREPLNHARFVFFNPQARKLYSDWDSTADEVVALLRTESARNPYSPIMSSLLGELSARSEDFRTKWAAYEIRHHYTGFQHFHHDVVGDLALMFEVMDLAADPGLSLLILSAEPDSPSEAALRLLDEWANTLVLSS
ncbi:helix-turn-helix transcriptional regulator [bacterium RCC_150]